MLIQYFQQLAAYIETGKEITKADFIRRLDRVSEVKDNIKQIVHQTIFSSVVKSDDGNVVLV